jgi:hypothetical protein
MTSSLIPERPLQISPSLAATIGLEEATLLALLSELAEYREPQWRQGVNWYVLDEAGVAAKMPFWTDHDVQRISQSLRAKGVILLQSAPFCQSRQLVFGFNEQQPVAAPVVQAQGQPQASRGIPIVNPPQAGVQAGANGQQGYPSHSQNMAQNNGAHRLAQQPIARGATVMPPNWQPSAETLAHIAQHNIPEQFVRDQLPEFVTFWRESGESHRSWGAKFQQQVLRKWREHENFTASREQDTAMTASWRPSQDAMEVLTTHAAINPQFVEDAIPEFVLFWRERGDVSRTWNSKFIQHVRRQWARYSSALEHDTEPRRISENWQPGDDVYDVLRLANIDVAYAQSLVPEFVIFWRDSNQVHNSWNTKFLQHVKRYWAQRHALGSSQGNHYAGQQAATQSGRTKDHSVTEQLGDRSWAV